MQGNECKILATAIASFGALSQQQTADGDPWWREILVSAIDDLKNPYLGAIFQFLHSSADYSVLVRKCDLPLRDRIGIAVRFMKTENVWPLSIP